MSITGLEVFSPCVLFGLNLVKGRSPHISEVQEINSFIDVQEKQIW